MHISHLVIKNFRVLEDIQLELVPRINVFVGPNAIGKTTLLQAIRLPKALAAPRTPNEAQQNLISLGAASPHFPQRIFLGAIARDLTKPVEIRCTYKFSDDEIAAISADLQNITFNVIQSRMGQSFGGPANLIQYLGSPAGRQIHSQTAGEVSSALQKLKTDKSVTLGITIDRGGSQINAADPIGAIFISFLDTRLEPQLSKFSYFPADRAMPVGEVPIQLGMADTSQQIESHNSQPQIKYQRLKNAIFNAVIKSEEDRKSITQEFDKIFSGILTGRRVLGPRVNEIGLLSVVVEEVETHRQFDIDSLSSGEKGLILTFLLIAKTVAKGGIILLDEPELHLNPAVCRDILPFMFDNYAKPNDLQLIICSHSPQILTSAFDRDEFALFHLESPTLVSKVGRRAFDELTDALQQLGVSVSESFLYKGTVLVEGDSDVRLIEEGFGEQLRRYQITDRGGRRQIEKTIERLQEMERKGEKVDPIFLIFDNDAAPTDLKSSAAVKILQWSRHCLENYLIEIDIIAELLKSEELAKEPGIKTGELEKQLRDLSFSQLNELAVRKIYRELNYLSPNLRVEDVDKQASIELMASNLYRRFLSAKQSLPDISEEDWTSDFVRRCHDEQKLLEVSWEAHWKDKCNGKRLFENFLRSGRLKVSLQTFKKRIMQQMKSTKSESWKLIAKQLSDLVGSQT